MPKHSLACPRHIFALQHALTRTSVAISSLLVLSMSSVLLNALPQQLDPADFTEVFFDDFTYTDEVGSPAVNPLYWNLADDDTINNSNRGALRDPSAVSVSNGLVTLYTYTDDSDPANPIHYSASLNSKDKFHTNFGYYEARMRWDNIVGGTAGAFWLMPGSTPGSDPATGQEIDVIEYRAERYGRFYADGVGNNSGVVIPLDDRMHFGLHWDGYGTNQTSIWGTLFPNGYGNSLLDQQFHTYGLLWTPNEYVIYFDNVEQLRLPRPYQGFDTNFPNNIPNEIEDLLLMLSSGSSTYYQGDLPGTTTTDEGWLARDPNGVMSKVYYPSSDKFRDETDSIRFSYEKAISYAMSHMIFSFEVRAPGNLNIYNESQDGWVGDIPSGGFGPLGSANNNKMTIDWVRYYTLNSLTDIQQATNTATIPGTIRAADYDSGGQGSSYFERVGSGAAGVDTGTYPSGGDYVIPERREWLEYTLDVTDEGYYAVLVQMANPSLADPNTMTNAELNGLGATLAVSVNNIYLDTLRANVTMITALEDRILPYLTYGIPYLTTGDVINLEAKSNQALYLDAIDFIHMGNTLAFVEAEDGNIPALLDTGLATERPNSLAAQNFANYIVGFNQYDNAEVVDFVHGQATYDNMVLPHWSNEDAKLFLAYSGTYNSNKQPKLTVVVNGDTTAATEVTFVIDDTQHAISSHQWDLYRIEVIDIPASLLVSGANTITVLANNANNQGIRLDWLALGSTIAQPQQTQTIEIEAEDATLFGNTGSEAYIGTTSSAHGPNNQYVDGLNKSNAGLEWTNIATTAGTADLVIHYASTASPPASKSLSVNGVLIDDQLTFSNTTGSKDFSGVVTVTGITIAGDGTDAIKIWRSTSAPGGNSGALRVDYIEIIMSSGTPQPVDITVEAESGTTFGNVGNEAIVGTHNNASSDAYIDRLNKSNAGVDITLPTFPAGQYNIEFVYATNATNAAKTIKVNSIVIDDGLGFSPSSGNTTFDGSVTLSNVTLSGTDVITVMRDSNSSSGNTGSVRLDYIRVYN